MIAKQPASLRVNKDFLTTHVKLSEHRPEGFANDWLRALLIKEVPCVNMVDTTGE